MSGRLPTALAGEIATIGQDITAPIAGFTLTTRDEILTRRGGGQGLKIYQDLARDGHTGAVLRKRRAAVVALEWTVEPGGEAPADLLAAELARVALKRISFDRVCGGLLGSVLTGYAVAEVMWEAAELSVVPEGAAPARRPWIVPSAIKLRNPRRFVFAGDAAELRLLTWDAPVEGIALPERKFILSRFWAEENEDPYGRGLGHDLFWPVFFKRNGIALWNALLERFGQPFVYAEYPPGTPVDERNKLLGALGDIARGAGLVVPQGSLVKLLEVAGGGAATGQAQAKLVEVMNAEISKIVLGETQTTEQGPNGARASAEVHDEVRGELRDADAAMLSEDLAPFLRWLTEINIPGAQPPMVWRKPSEQPDLAAEAKLDETLTRVGYEPTEERVNEVYGPGYRRLNTRPPSTPPGPFGAPAPGAASNFAAAPLAPPTPDRVQAIAARELEPLQQLLLAAVQAEMQAATSFEDLDARLLRLSASMPVQPLAEGLAQAMALAALAGHADVLDAAAEDADEAP